jgi:hypothetical protein
LYPKSPNLSRNDSNYHMKIINSMYLAIHEAFINGSIKYFSWGVNQSN